MHGEKHQIISAKGEYQQIGAGAPAIFDIHIQPPHTGWQERKCSLLPNSMKRVVSWRKMLEERQEEQTKLAK